MADSPKLSDKAILESLLQERKELDSAIAYFKRKAGMSVSPGDESLDQGGGSGSGVQGGNGGSIRSDFFVGLSVVEAAKKYLAMTNAPQTTQALVDVFAKGGKINTYATVFATLRRQARNVGDIRKLPSKEWGLQEWYSGRT